MIKEGLCLFLTYHNVLFGLQTLNGILFSALRKHDVVFIVTVRPTHAGLKKYDRTKPFREQVALSRLSCSHYFLPTYFSART